MKGFENSLKIGKSAEELIKRLLEEDGYIVQDVSDSKVCRLLDIDLVVTGTNNNKPKTDALLTGSLIEIKNDSKMSVNNNIFIEMGFMRKTGYYNGWAEYCEADYIFFNDSVSQKIYIVDWQRLKRYLDNLKVRNFYNKTDDCVGYFKTINIEEAIEKRIIIKTINLNEKKNSFFFLNNETSFIKLIEFMDIF